MRAAAPLVFEPRLSEPRLLHVDFAAERAFDRIVGSLRSARLKAGLTQDEAASGLPVRGRTISDWECGGVRPTLGHLIQWAGRFDHRLVILGLAGYPMPGPTRPRPGEAWEHFERRRLAWPLRSRRIALGMSQGGLGELIGVSRDSIQRWELTRVPPRPMAHVVWAQKLGYTLALRPVSIPRQRIPTARLEIW